MTQATLELLAALARLNREMPNVALGITDGSLPAEKQVEFGDLLITAGRAIQHHARTERGTVIDSHAASSD